MCSMAHVHSFSKISKNEPTQESLSLVLMGLEVVSHTNALLRISFQGVMFENQTRSLEFIFVQIVMTDELFADMEI